MPAISYRRITQQPDRLPTTTKEERDGIHAVIIPDQRPARIGSITGHSTEVRRFDSLRRSRVSASSTSSAAREGSVTGHLQYPRYMTVLTVPLHDYTVDIEPDHGAIGRRVDDAIRERFTGHKIVARGLSADDHPGHDVDELINIILTSGTDRYDPDRPGDRYAAIGGKRIDLFGFRRAVTPRMNLFANLSWGFYHGSIEIHGHPTRLDIVTIYDARQLRAVLHQYEGRPDRKRDGFRFADPQRPAAAVLGIVKLDR